MNENPPWEFTCKTCGDHNLSVSHVWTILAGPETETWQEWGLLEPNHLWHYKFKERVVEEKNRDNEVERGDFGPFLEDDSSSKPEDFEIFEPQNNPGNDRFYVNCAGCDRDIEFGWSERNRGGRIYPVECSDFAPAKIWAEPRYLNSWHKKGWLQNQQRI